MSAPHLGRVRSVRASTRLAEAQMGPGFSAHGLRHVDGVALDPFLSVDHFRMSQPTFPPHPHAGFSAVTYMFEDSPGGFTNRDSLGDVSRIGPGALHWTQAARGMMHEEIPERRGVVCHGLQMFVNLRADHKQAPPRAFHADAAAIPEVSVGAGTRVRVLAGSLAGARSPLDELLTPVLLLDVHLEPSARAHLPVDAPSAFALGLAGAGVTGPAGAPRDLDAHVALAFAADGDHLELEAGPAGLHVLIGAGHPIGEPVVFGGPFAMTTRRDVEAAHARFQRGEMGRLAPSF